MSIRSALILAATLAGLVSAPLQAADDGPPAAPAAKPVADPLGTARKHIAGKQWPQAIAELQRVNASGNADWNNLMGYALRKQATPDLAGAQRHYDEALRLNPAHRGALEYAGELALMKGDLPTAEARAKALAAVCPGGCEELADLKQAVERYKAAGNRYMAGS